MMTTYNLQLTTNSYRFRKVFGYFIIFPLLLVISGWLSVGETRAQSNINTIERWAWNDVIGWLDFRYAANPNVVVTSSEVQGYALSSVGFISLNCAYGPPGSDCTIPYSVTNSNGVLSGWGWSDQIGWVSFNCNNSGIGNQCGSSNYGVTITNGNFQGWAWNDVIGWLSFDSDDCDQDQNGFWDVNCGGDNLTTAVTSFGVQTSWGTGAVQGNLTSSVLDTNDANGVALRTIMWQGVLNSGDVAFQVASSNSDSGPWNFLGLDGTDTTFYGAGSGPNIQILLRPADHNNKRYFRYKIFLDSDVGGTQSPTVQDVIIGYSP
jgi:hypothetical protein